MAFTTNEIVTRIVADNKKFDGVMKGSIQVMERFNKKGDLIGSSVKVMTKHLDDASKKTNSFRDAMVRLSRDIKVANTIFDTLKAGIRGAYEAASEGAKIMAAEQFFKNAGKSIEGYRRATSGMVSDAELMKKANLADSMGIDEKTFKKLVMVAEAAALKTGQSFDYMFNSIIVGTARSSRLLLDNLGIIVSVKQANEAYAASIGKTVEQLTAEEKQIAFVNEVARKSQGTLDEYAKATDRTAESFARFDANVQNLADSLKVGLAKAFATVLPALNEILKGLVEMLTDQNYEAAGEYAALSFLEGFARLMSKGESFLPAGLVGKLFGVDTTVFGLVADEISSKASEVRARAQTRSMANNNAAIEAAIAARQPLLDAFGADWEKTVQRMVDTGQTGYGEIVDTTVKNFLKANTAAKNFLGDFIRKAEEAPSGSSSGGKGRGRKPKAADDWGFEDFDRDLARAVRDMDFRDEGRRLAAPFISGVAQFDDGAARFDGYMKDWLARWKKANEEYLKMLVDKFAPVGEAITGVATGQGLFGPIVGAIGTMLGGFSTSITSALLAGGASGSVAGPLGAVLGALIPIVLSLIDSLTPVMTVVGAIVDGLRLFIENGLGQFLEPLKMLANPIKDLLASLGLLVGSALRPLVLFFTALVGIVAVVVEVFAVLVAGIAPFVEMFMSLLLTMWSAGFSLVSLFFDLGIATGNLRAGFNYAIDRMLDGVIWFNNAIVKFMRRTLGLKGFGKLLSRDDFRGRGEADPIDENTGAINENTRALRDFVREFRNLPQGYKGFGAVYASQDPQMEWRGPRRPSGIGMRSVDGLQNARWRT